MYLCSCSLTGSDQIWYHKQLEKLYLVVGWGLTAAHALWITMFRLLCGDMCFNECLCNCCVVHGFKYIKYEFVHSSGVVVCSIVLAWLEIKKAVLFISYACYVDKLMLSYQSRAWNGLSSACPGRFIIAAISPETEDSTVLVMTDCRDNCCSVVVQCPDTHTSAFIIIIISR